MSDEESNWREGLGEYADNPAFADFNSLESLAKAYDNTKRMVGNSIRIPGEDAGDEDRQAFYDRLLQADVGLTRIPDSDDAEGMQALYARLGRPEEASGYTEIEGIEGERFGLITKLAHEHGISDSQLQSVLGGVMQADKEAFEISESERRVGVQQLKGEWGDAYTEKHARLKNLAKITKAPPALIEQIESGEVGADTLRWLDSLAESMGGEGTQLSDDLGGVTENTRDELQAQFDEITRRLLDSSNPLSTTEYERLNKKRLGIMERLHKAA